jgi:DNA primase
MEEAGKDPIKRAALISSIVKSISVIPDSIVRSVYIRECSQLLEMEEKILVEATAKLIEQGFPFIQFLIIKALILLVV